MVGIFVTGFLQCRGVRGDVNYNYEDFISNNLNPKKLWIFGDKSGVGKRDGFGQAGQLPAATRLAVPVCTPRHRTVCGSITN